MANRALAETSFGLPRQIAATHGRAPPAAFNHAAMMLIRLIAVLTSTVMLAVTMWPSAAAAADDDPKPSLAGICDIVPWWPGC